MISPGLYQLCFRGITLREAWRFGGGPLQFALAVALKLRGLRGPRVWLPARECEAECTAEEHSEAARAALAPYLRALPAAGYDEVVLIRQVRNHDPAFREAAAAVALHRDHRRGLQIAFLRSAGRKGEKRALSLTGALLDADDLRVHEFVGHNNYFDAPGVAERTRVRARDLAAVDQAMGKALEAEPRRWYAAADLRDFRRRAAEVDDRIWRAHLERGLYVRVEES